MCKVVVYTKRFCGYCTAAKQLLKKRKIEYEEIDLTGDQQGLSELVEKAEGRRTVPQIFIDDKPIGGFTDLRDLDKSGQLKDMLDS